MQPQYGYGELTRSVSFGAGVDKATYIVEAVSRISGEETWNPDKRSNHHFVEVTIDGNTMTAQTVTHVYQKQFTINSVEVDGAAWAGQKTTLKVNATNTGSYYINTLYVFINGQLMSAIGVPFEPEETGEFYLSFTPEYAGNYRVSFCTSRYNQNTSIYQTNIAVSEIPTSITQLQAEDKNAAVFNLNGQQVGTCHDFDALPGGIYIVNRKKVMKK